MKVIKSVFVLFLLVVIISGCKKNDSTTNPTSEFSNKLQIGTGADYAHFAIAGETAAFTRSGLYANIYWRLESANDMGGSNVNMKVEKLVGSSYIADTVFAFTAAQSYGHIMMSSIALQHTGSFKMTGILVTGNVSVATTNFTVQ